MTTLAGGALSAHAASLAELVDQGATAEGVPGVAVAVVRGDEVLIHCHGVTSVEHPLPVDDRTLFQIGSTTKTFTASAAMALVERGDLTLDAPVCSILPSFRLADEEAGRSVTVADLMSHTGGWAGDWFLLTKPDYGREGALAAVVDDMWQAPAIVPPGTAFSYNNAGFYVLGRVVEAVAGESYPSAVRSLVLEPAGMHGSFFHADEMITERVAIGHVPGDGAPKVHRPWPRPFFAWPAGALCSSAEELVVWARTWLRGIAGEGSAFLSAASMAAMTAPRHPVDEGTSIGLGWMLRDVGGVRVVEHGGATNGYLSVFATCPERDFAVVVLSNASTAGALNRRIERWAFAEVAGVPEAGRPPAADAALQVDPTSYCGRYGLGPGAAWWHDVLVDDGALVLVGGSPEPPAEPPRYRLAFTGEDAVVVVEPEAAAGVRGTFGRDGAGEIAWLRFGLRIYNRL